MINQKDIKKSKNKFNKAKKNFLNKDIKKSKKKFNKAKSTLLKNADKNLNLPKSNTNNFKKYILVALGGGFLMFPILLVALFFVLTLIAYKAEENITAYRGNEGT